MVLFGVGILKFNCPRDGRFDRVTVRLKWMV
jgi:hypothetical protein